MAERRGPVRVIDYDRVLELWHQKWMTRAIAEDQQCSMRSVTRILRKRGLQPHYERRGPKKGEAEFPGERAMKVRKPAPIPGYARVEAIAAEKNVTQAQALQIYHKERLGIR